MKKNIIFAVVVATLALSPFSISFAQELTRNNVQIIVPSLMQVVSSLSNVVQSELVRRQAERSALLSLTPVLNSVATQVNQSNNNLTTSQINSLSSQLTPVYNLVSNITNRRLQFQRNLEPIVNTLAEITETIIKA